MATTGILLGQNNNNSNNNKIQINTKDITYYYKAYIRGQINS